MCVQKSMDESVTSTSISTISTEKIFIENPYFKYADSWNLITNHINI